VRRTIIARDGGRSAGFLVSVSGAALLLVAAVSVPEPAQAQFFNFYGGGGYAPRPSFYPRSYFDGGYQFRRRSHAAPRGDSSMEKKVNAEAKKPAPPPPAGPLTIAISIANQRVTVYDRDQPIMESQVSTGVPGHPTPTGIFSVIGKERWHRSNLYSGAPMPWMQRITWSGVAMHQGVVPGHPASHGCIRLPEQFAIRLFHTTKMGARVLIAQGPLAPTEFSHPRLFTPAKPVPVASASPSDAPADVASDKRLATPENATAQALTPAERVTDALQTLKVVANETAGPSEVTQPPSQLVGAPTGNATTAPADAPKSAPTEAPAQAAAPKTQTAMPIIMAPFPASPAPSAQEKPLRAGPISVFVSRKEGKLFVRKGFDPVFQAPVKIARADQPLGTHLFTAVELKDDGNAMRWLAVTMPAPRRGVVERPTTRDRRHPAPKVVEAPVPSGNASDALDRIDIPPEAVARISELLTPGASLIISDQGLGPETGKETDFIVLTR